MHNVPIGHAFISTPGTSRCGTRTFAKYLSQVRWRSNIPCNAPLTFTQRQFLIIEWFVRNSVRGSPGKPFSERRFVQKWSAIWATSCSQYPRIFQDISFREKWKMQSLQKLKRNPAYSTFTLRGLTPWQVHRSHFSSLRKKTAHLKYSFLSMGQPET